VAARVAREAHAFALAPCAQHPGLVAWEARRSLGPHSPAKMSKRGLFRVRPMPPTKRRAWLKHRYQEGICQGEMKANQALRRDLAAFCDQRRKPKAPCGTAPQQEAATGFRGDQLFKQPRGHKFAFPRRESPGALRQSRPRDREGAGKTECPPAPVGPRAKKLRKSAKTTGGGGITPAFPARWFDGLFRALLGEPAFATIARVMRSIITNLTPAWARQDHTALPYANVLLVCQHLCVHRIPHRVRDDSRSAPLAGWDSGDHTTESTF
jgi:hypothetical protein